MFRLYRQLSGQTRNSNGQFFHDKAQDEMAIFFQDIGLKNQTALDIATFVASKHSYSNQDILASCKISAKEVVKVIYDYVESNHALPGYYGINLNRDTVSELFEILSKMIEPTPAVATMFTPNDERTPKTENFISALYRYLQDPKSSYAMPDQTQQQIAP
jgi:hypothetical protein